jgi:hypothetical protein
MRKVIGRSKRIHAPAALVNPFTSMALDLHHRVVIGFQRQIAALGIALEEPSFLKKSRYTMTNGMHQRFEFIDVGRFYPAKAQASIVILHSFIEKLIIPTYLASPGVFWPTTIKL